MKRNKLKTIAIILLILLLTMVGFLGVFFKDKNTMKNGVKDYQYGMDFSDKRIVELELDTSTSEVIKDKDGNVIESATDEEIKEKGYTKEEKAVNSKESITEENYQLTKEILENRLKTLGVSSYTVKYDDETGKIVVELPEGSNTDNWVSSLTTVGKLEILDTETNELLLSNKEIKDCGVYSSSSSSGRTIYFSIEFNDEGKKKLEEITKTYVAKKEESKDSSTSEETDTNTTSDTVQNNTVNEQANAENKENTTTANSEETKNEENKEETSKTEENKEKTITMKLDGVEVMKDGFETPITDGKLSLTVGKESTDVKQLNENLVQARNVATVLANKNLPLTYKISSGMIVKTSIQDKVSLVITIGITVFIVLMLVVFAIRFKVNGLLATTANIGFAALLLLMFRYWNVVISIEGIVALVAVVILNFILTNKILSNIKKPRNKNVEQKTVINKAIIDFTLKVIPLFIMAIVFSFAKLSSASSFGMVMFWGLTIIELYNLIITKNLLKNK